MKHDFDPGYTGLSTECNVLVPDEDGYADTCNKPKDDPIHDRSAGTDR